MKRIGLIILAVLTLALLVYPHSRTPKAKSETPTSPPQTGGSTDRTLATQRRIGRYFQNGVVPKLRNCWKDVQGEGLIEFKSTYTKAGGNWTWESLGVSSSTLLQGQDKVASKCMQEAVRGTSFPVEQGDSVGNIKGEDKFVVYWSWPVPLPANAAEFAEFRAKKGGGKTGGCDGLGTPAKCWTCSETLNCIKVCVGVRDCKPGTSPSGGRACIEIGSSCASGGPKGWDGGVIM
jgi:hypothetical protein